MDLLEYQAKQLFHQVGIPVLPSETIAEPRALKQLQIPYPVVLKSQVRAGGRGKAGGVKFVGNTIDAIAAARNIFNLSILGEYPEVILAEAKYDSKQELFLSILIDYEQQCPVIFGSCQGGMDLQSLKANLQQVAVETGFSSYLARTLAVKMGLKGDLLLGVSDIIEKMYRLFEENNLDFIEINPLATDAQGKLMALDGKIATKDENILATNRLNDPAAIEKTKEQTVFRWLDWQNSQGKIAIIGSESDSVLLCWDLLQQQKGKPALGIVLNMANYHQLSSQQLGELFFQLQERKVEIVLANLWLNRKELTHFARTIDGCFERASEVTLDSASLLNLIPFPNSAKIKLILRIPDAELAHFQQQFPHPQLVWTNDLADAVDLAISLSKAT